MADRATKSLCSAIQLLIAGHGIDLRPTQSLLFHKRGGRIPFQTCGERDYLEIRMTERPRNPCHHVVQREPCLKSEMRALRTGHLTATVARPRGHLKRNVVVKSTATLGTTSASRRVVFRDIQDVCSCAFDHASVTFNEADETVTVSTGTGPRGACLCRVVPRKGQRLKEFFSRVS